MSKADRIFIDMCSEIIENGTTTEGEKVRPTWEDGTSAYTIKKFGVCNRYDLREEFPALTLRRTALKSGLTSLAPLAKPTVIRLDRFLTTPMAIMTRWIVYSRTSKRIRSAVVL